MSQFAPEGKLSIEAFQWKHWRSLWQLRFCQLAEHGIHLPPDAFPPHPAEVERDDAEWDYHHMAAVYLKGAGGFWLAHSDAVPVGHVGGQDIGGAVELRRMYVRAEFRRCGIGQRLVSTLVAHCAQQRISAVELWTAQAGAGRKLYETTGFHAVDAPGSEFANVAIIIGWTPGEDEIRMRLQLG